MTWVVMPVMSAGQEQAWHTLMDLHEAVPPDWALVGGQMVHLHCAERGGAPPRPTDGMQHRWKRDRAQIDVLIPEGTGQRAESRGGVHGAPTVAAPGTTQALARASDIEVEVAGRRGMVRRPSLVGALVGKAAARINLGSGAASGRHCVDFVVLAGLLSASDFRDEALSPKDRKRLRLMLDVCTRDPAALSVENATENLQRLSLAAGLS